MKKTVLIALLFGFFKAQSVIANNLSDTPTIENAFGLFDENKDGLISVQELQNKIQVKK
jgi:Ca2+-binding EF-hand superfamily protein